MFSPSVKFDKKLNPVFSLSANASINQDANTIDVPVRNAITNNYRTFTDGIDSLNINKTDMVSGPFLSEHNTSLVMGCLCCMD